MPQKSQYTLPPPLKVQKMRPDGKAAWVTPQNVLGVTDIAQKVPLPKPRKVK